MIDGGKYTMSEILINQLFAGSYLQEGTNIGHEIINIFRDDNDENYLFITPYGNVNGHDVDKVLFVQNIKARETMEIVMKAEGLSKTSLNEIQRIFYAGVNIVDIFNKNLYHGKKELVETETMATYRAETIRFPKKGKRIILTVDSNYSAEDENSIVIFLDPDKKKIVGQSMRTYLSKESYSKIYGEIEGLIENDSLWEDHNDTQKMISDGSYTRTNISFLEIIRKENDELIMSNLLAYYFNYNHRMFVKFTEDVLGVDGFGTSFEITRESVKNIDLWIRDEHQILVIENKIKSGLNGKTDDGKNQLNKYYEYTEKIKKEEKLEAAHYYLFVPNYNDIMIENSLIKDKFKVIYYSEIYDFFRNNAAEYLSDKYFPDFLRGLKNQTMTYSELRFSIMRSRFIEKINQR